MYTPTAVILIGSLLFFAALAGIFYTTMPYRRKARVIRLIRQLQEEVTLGNFQNSFNRKYRRRQVVKPILDAIDAGVIDPTTLGLDPRSIKNLGKGHVDRLVAIYKLSLVAGHWKTYAQAKKGYRTFGQFAFINEIQSEPYHDIRKDFCRRLYVLASHEYIASLDNGSVQKKLTKEFDFSLDEIQEWCIKRQESRAVPRQKISAETTS